MRNIWLSSDWHFHHNKNFIWESRGFSSIDEMNEAVIERYNQLVKDNDTVYILGDCMLGKLQPSLQCINRLKGQKYLAYGNHDTDVRLKAYTASRLFKDIQMGYRIKIGKRTFICTHYPTIVANNDDDRVIGLYAHTHQQTNFFSDEAGTRTNMYHVGVDSHNCYPINLEDIIAEIKKVT